MDLGAITGLVGLLVGLPSALVGLREYRRRPRLEARVTLGPGLHIDLANAGEVRIGPREYNLVLMSGGTVTWQCYGAMDGLGPGERLSINNPDLFRLVSESIRGDAVLTLKHRSRKPRRLMPARLVTSAHSWHILDPSISAFRED